MSFHRFSPVAPAAILVAKRVLFPGVNLHARDRLRRIPQKFGPEIGPGTHVLDAGCGNGMLSQEAWKRGATVLGISIKQKEVDGCRAMFNQGQGIAGGTLRFENVNLYSLSPQVSRFDAIICTEVLEHIRDDRSVCQKFFELLKPGACLHVTSPNAGHPDKQGVPARSGGTGRARPAGLYRRHVSSPVRADWF